MSGLKLLAAAVGLVTVLGGFAGLSWWSSRDAVAASPDEWRPKCVARLGWQDVDVVATRVTHEPSLLLFGLDMSPSNAELVDTQLDAVVRLAQELPAELDTGILLVSDRSDRSATPDAPLEPSIQVRETTIAGLPCWPDCPDDSLFAQRCRAQLDKAVEARTGDLEAELAEQRMAFVRERGARLSSWREEIRAWRPRPGTSLLRFWHKVADLPQVRRSPGRARVVLFSDLEESGTRERAVVERFHRGYEREGSCPSDPALPDLEGVDILLVQTVIDRVRPEVWGARWQTLLGCAGASVVRRRYSPGIPLSEYLGSWP